MYRFLLHQVYLVIIVAMSVTTIQPPIMPNLDLLNIKPKIENLNKIPLKGKQVPPCIACQSLVKSFLAAVAKTTRQSFAGGDADWEKQKLGTYENSELRLIEIQEMLCSDVDLGKDQCYNLAEVYESKLEEWFYEKRQNEVDLLENLCIDHIKVCCPNNTYGPNCIPCPGGIEKPCGGHGKCRKGGTREESASCSCDVGYSGELCTQCDKGYFDELGTPELSCKKCDVACKGYCRGPGPNNCEVCAVGYQFIPNKGCSIEVKREDNTSKRKIENIKHSDEPEKSSQVNTSADFVKDDQLQLKPNIEDSSVKVPHSEF